MDVKELCKNSLLSFPSNNTLNNKSNWSRDVTAEQAFLMKFLP